MATRSLLAQVRARRKSRKPGGRVPRQQEPKAIQLAYFTELRRMTQRARALVRGRLLPLLPELAQRAAERRRGRRDSFVDVFIEYVGKDPSRLRAFTTDAMDPGKRINKLMDRVSESFYREWDPSKLTALARKYGEATSVFQKEQLARQLRAKIGIDPVIAEPGLAQRIKDFTAENVALIKSIPQQYFDQVEARVINGVRTGQRHEEMAKGIQERFGVAESRAKLIARDQTLKFYGELNAARQQAMGVDKYTWRTSEDSRVRDAHSEFNGNVYSWDDPPGDGSPQEGTHPATAINCRCTAEPVLDDLFAALEGKESAEEKPEAELAESEGDESSGRGQARAYTPGEGRVRTGPEDSYWVPVASLEDLFAKPRDPGRTAQIVKGFAEGKVLPPIQVGMDVTNGGRAIVDGMHRLAAAREAGRTHLRVRFFDEMAHARGALVEKGKVTDEVRRKALIEIKRESYKGTEWEKSWKDLPDNRFLFDGSPLPPPVNEWY